MLIVGNAGVVTFVQASRVSKTWRAACLDYEAVLVACALGPNRGLSGEAFAFLFRLELEVSRDCIPFVFMFHRSRPCALQWYGPSAIQRALSHAYSGHSGWKSRVNASRDHTRVDGWVSDWDSLPTCASVRSLYERFEQDARAEWR